MSCLNPLHSMLLCFELVKAEDFRNLALYIRRFRQQLCCAEFLQHCFPQMSSVGSKVGQCSFSNGRRKLGLRSSHSPRYRQTIHRIPAKEVQIINYKEIGSCPIKITRSKTFSSEIQKKLVFGGLVEFLFTHLFYGKSH